jgi:hypothetical protein
LPRVAPPPHPHVASLHTCCPSISPTLYLVTYAFPFAPTCLTRSHIAHSSHPPTRCHSHCPRIPLTPLVSPTFPTHPRRRRHNMLPFASPTCCPLGFS